MLVAANGTHDVTARARRCLRNCLLVLVLSAASIAPYLTSSTELVRIRNALLLLDDSGRSLDWEPNAMPPDFLVERGPIDPEFAEATKQLGLENMASDWDRVLAISRHLLSNPDLNGPPIQSDLRDTYHRIIANGDGYCGDFTRVFMAFAIASGIPVRAWAFSLDGFGGHGHVWPEIWNRSLKRWQLVDIYNNFYFYGSDGIPISAMEFRHAMLTDPRSIQHELLSAHARPGYAYKDKLWAWYQEGLAGWYVVWGNNVFTYDRTLRSLNLGHFSRSLEQIAAIVWGVYPHEILLVDDTNRDAVTTLWRLRTHLLIVLVLGAIASLTALFCTALLVHSMRRRRFLRSP